MDDIRRMNVLQSFQDLIDDERLMDLLKNFSSNDRMEIGLYELANEIKIVRRVGSNQREQFDHIFVVGELF